MNGPYRRQTNAVMVEVGVGTAARTAVPADFIPKNASSFQVVNSALCWVRLKGFKDVNGTLVEGEGWLFPPGHVGVYATQQPTHMMALAVARPGFPVTQEVIAPLEVNYGYGI